MGSAGPERQLLSPYSAVFGERLGLIAEKSAVSRQNREVRTWKWIAAGLPGHLERSDRQELLGARVLGDVRRCGTSRYLVSLPEIQLERKHRVNVPQKVVGKSREVERSSTEAAGLTIAVPSVY